MSIWLELAIMAYFALVAVCWGWSIARFQRLVRVFARKMPDVVARVPSLEPGFRHPNKLLFFVAKGNRELLRSDLEVWSLRRKATRLLQFATLLAVLGIMGVVALFLMG